MATSKKPERDLSTPDIPASAATLAVYASTRINAPASLVFRTLRNTETWKDWNRWVPKVVITYQPPEEDVATVAEISELVRNTSIAGSVDSDITDGAAADPLPVHAHPESLSVTLHRQRLASNASKTSDPARSKSTSSANGVSGAQKFAAAQASRKASIASGNSPPPAANNLVESPQNPAILLPAPPNTAATATAMAARRRGSVTAAQKRAMSINALYGEPSVRIQLHTRMTFHIRMKMPSSYALDKETAIVVTEVSRPDDIGDGDDITPGNLARSQTHTLSRGGVYRIVWSMATSYSPPKSFPKFMLQAQRVHEIRPVVRGDGKEECVYEDWELQKGVLAKGVKAKYGEYIQKRFEGWGLGLKDFTESLGGAVERRDFIDEAHG